MSGYIIANVQVTDPVQYEEYKKWSTAAMKAYDAEVCVRGGQVAARLDVGQRRLDLAAHFGGFAQLAVQLCGGGGRGSGYYLRQQCTTRSTAPPALFGFRPAAYAPWCWR